MIFIKFSILNIHYQLVLFSKNNTFAPDFKKRKMDFKIIGWMPYSINRITTKESCVFFDGILPIDVIENIQSGVLIFDSSSR